MKSDVEKLSPTRVKMTVEVPYEELKPSIDAAYTSVGAQLRVPGFRPGKVPNRIIDQRVGRPVVVSEAINDALPQLIASALDSEQIVAIGQPSVDVTEAPIAEGDALIFSVDTEVRPEVELPDLSDITVTVDPVVVGADEVEERLTDLRQRFGTLVGVDRPVQDGDFVSIDLSATLGDEEIDSVTGVSYEVGSGNMLEGMDEALVGMTAGETKEFTAPLAGGDHVGEEADCTVTVQSVKIRELPEADDEFAQLASEFDTVEELRTQISAQLEAEGILTQTAQARDRLVEHLFEKIDVPLPEGIIEAQVHAHLEGEDRLDDDEHRAEVDEGARRELKLQFILDTLAEERQVAAEPQDVLDYLVMFARRFNVDPNELGLELEQTGRISAMVSEVTRRKALATVLETLHIVDTNGKVIDLTLSDRPEEDHEMDVIDLSAPSPYV
ncbi:MAG TPA: trigger factor [Intrasporangiaceae bacterium]|nr:trigger factor [Intrasporangiaceae bacterium]